MFQRTLGKAALFACSTVLSASCTYGQEVNLVALKNTISPSSRVQPKHVFDSESIASDSQNGTLLLCGGGLIPKTVRDRFYKAGKQQKGSLVVIPTASESSDRGEFARFIDYWAEYPWANVSILHVENRQVAIQDKQPLQLLENATAVWIAGGDQSRLSDRYAGTPVEMGLKSLIQRGGIVGGTSAGAAIASSTMISGGYVEPKLGHGFSMLTNAIVDQHFSQKGRSTRLRSAIGANPSRTGIGIDESTGLFISPKKSFVVGEGTVFVYKANCTPFDSGTEVSRPSTDAESTMDTQQLQNGDEIETLDLDVFAK